MSISEKTLRMNRPRLSLRGFNPTLSPKNVRVNNKSATLAEAYKISNYFGPIKSIDESDDLQDIKELVAMISPKGLFHIKEEKNIENPSLTSRGCNESNKKAMANKNFSPRLLPLSQKRTYKIRKCPFNNAKALSLPKLC